MFHTHIFLWISVFYVFNELSIKLPWGWFQRQVWPIQQSVSSVGEPDQTGVKCDPDQTGVKCDPDHLTIPNDGTDVWEIDPKHLKFGSKIASGSYGDL